MHEKELQEDYNPNSQEWNPLRMTFNVKRRIETNVSRDENVSI